MVVILDTGFILALRNKNDQNHEIAINLMKNSLLKGIYGRIILTDYVYDELMTLILVRIKNKQFALDTKNFLLKSKKLTLMKITDEVFKFTLLEFERYFDQKLSFTDCTFLALNKIFTSNYFCATFDTTLDKLVPGVN